MSQLHFISAGAGSGKTHRLTQILGEALQSGAARPAGVIATTFTKKAASELRERVRSHLLREGQFHLANRMGQARIGTVNSVCGGLLQRFAFEAGLSPEQQVIEENQAALLIRRALDEATTDAQRTELNTLAERLGIEDWPKLLKSLIDLARSNGIDAQRLAAMGETNAQALLAHFPKATSEALSQSVAKEIAQILPTLQPLIEASTVQKAKAYLSVLLDMQRALNRGNAPWSLWIKLLKVDPGAKLKVHTEGLADLLVRYDAHPDLHSDIRQWCNTLFNIAADALAHYAEQKRELGVVDFSDQERLTLELLDHPTVEATLAEELDLLLVDEFQDTSPIQLAVFLKLTRLAKETYWVGDIKQAIYGFRGSDTRLMQSVLAALPALGGDKTLLSASWRSRPALVQLVNALFIPAFAQTLSADEVALNPQRPETLAQTSGAAVLEIWHLASKNVNIKAQSLAEGVQDLYRQQHPIIDPASRLSRALRYSDIAILAKTNENVQTIAGALRQFGIPVATNQAGLLETPEAVLALACLRRLNDPRDTLASAEIIAMTSGEPAESWISERLHSLAKGDTSSTWREDGDNASPLLRALASLRQQASILSPSEALQHILSLDDLSRAVLRWQTDAARARQRLANLEALLALSRDYEEHCGNTQHAATLSGLLLWLTAQADNHQDTLAQPALDAVRVMTHHAAKGLEWPVVILTDLEKGEHSRLWTPTASAPEGIDLQNPLAKRHLHYWPWPFGKQSSNIAVDAVIEQSDTARQFQHEAREEARRLLYVSMTRPRDLLILALPTKAKAYPWLDTLEADWLALDTDDTAAFTLPDGTPIPCHKREYGSDEALNPNETTPQQTQLHWFPAAQAQSHPPRILSPSQAEPVPCEIVERETIGQRLPIQGYPDMAVFGTAIHAVLAASFTDPQAPVTEDECQALLERFGVAHHVRAADVLQQTQSLHAWITRKWPDAKAYAEVPIESRMENGQVMNGRIDLLVEAGEQRIIIDHKMSSKDMDKHATQLFFYRDHLPGVTALVVNAYAKGDIIKVAFLIK